MGSGSDTSVQPEQYGASGAIRSSMSPEYISLEPGIPDRGGRTRPSTTGDTDANLDGRIPLFGAVTQAGLLPAQKLVVLENDLLGEVLHEIETNSSKQSSRFQINESHVAAARGNV